MATLVGISLLRLHRAFPAPLRGPDYITKKLTKAQEQEVLLTSKALFQKLQENRQKILVVDWYKDEQTRAKVKSTIEEVLNAQNPPHLPDCYDIDLFNVKSNLLLNHFIDMAVQGYGWARGGVNQSLQSPLFQRNSEYLNIFRI